jgi:calcineurin-like phosphoesterase family protein
MKFVDLKKLWNIVVDHFSFEFILSCKTTFEIQNFKIQIFEKLRNFVVDNLLIWIHLGPQTINFHLV